MEYLNNKSLTCISLLMATKEDLDSSFDVILSQNKPFLKELSEKTNIDYSKGFLRYEEELIKNIKNVRTYLINNLTINVEENDYAKYFNDLSLFPLNDFDLNYLNKLFELETKSYWFNEFQKKKHITVKENVEILYEKLKETLKEDLENGYEENEDLKSLLKDKRPFGNKNIPESIIYTLGFDSERRLTSIYRLPDYFIEIANDYFQLVETKVKLSNYFLK